MPYRFNPFTGTLDIANVSSAPNAIGTGQRDVNPSLSVTQLTPVATESYWVAIAAKPTNLAVIWVAGSTVEDGIGIPLYAQGAPVNFYIDDISKVYFIGSSGDGVVYTFGYRQSETSDDEGGLLGVDGGSLLGVGGDVLGGVS